ncbi:MAG: carbonic anhydrase [Marinilabiliales bacterium]|nr:MAG: carbonic anhydrase [Marinilabiliales bacterium]
MKKARTLTKEVQQNITPEMAMDMLINGNKRFVEKTFLVRDFDEQIEITKDAQAPFAVTLSCIDSRVSARLIFDLGIGDMFSVKIAGNIVNKDVLASLEYSCKVAGAKIIVVLAHTKCGAVTAACNNFKLGNITSLLEKIKPAIDKVNLKKITDDSINQVSIENAKYAIEKIRNESKLLFEMEKNNEIKLVGAMYDVSNGMVKFLL